MNKQNIISLAALIIIFAVGFWVINPMLTNLKDTNLKVSAKNQEINLSKQKISDFNTLKSEFSKYQSQVSQLAISAPSSEQMPEILVQLSALAQKSGLEVNSIQPTTATTGADVGVTVSVKGGFSANLMFLQNLEKNARPVNVKSMNMASSQSDGAGLLSTTYSLGFIKAQ